MTSFGLRTDRSSYGARRVVLGGALLALVLASPCAAAGGEKSDVDRANARFEEGRVFAERGEWAKACPKFAESEQALPSGRAIYNLGDCYEHLGKYASALREFEEALRRARAAKKTEIADNALRRVSSLSPKVSRLVIDARDAVGQAAVKVDGELVMLGNLGQEGLAVDPGEHVLTATAPHKKTWTKTVFFGEERSSQTVSIPALEDAIDGNDTRVKHDGTDGTPLPPKVETPDQGRFPARTVGIAAGGAGLVAVGIGVALGLAASSRLDHVRAVCPNGTCANDAARAQGDSDLGAAHDLATGSTVCIVAGAVIAAAGITIAIVDPFAPNKKSQSGARTTTATVGGRPSLQLVLGPSRVGLAGTF